MDWQDDLRNDRGGRMIDRALNWLDRHHFGLILGGIISVSVAFPIWFEAEGWPHRFHWLFEWLWRAFMHFPKG